MKRNKQVVYLDMDGTIADLYNQQDWLPKLRNEESGLFANLKPMVSESRLLELFPSNEYDIRILTMLPKGASKEYEQVVTAEKNQWLDKHFPTLKKRIFKKYGNNKNLKGSCKAVLIDDNEEIRNNFRGLAISPMRLW